MTGNKLIAFNSILIFLKISIVSVVSIIVSRIVLDALGASDFGLYNVVGGLVALINTVNMAMSGATYRFIATEMGKGGEGNLNKVFNTSFSIHMVFAVVILLLGLTIGEWYVFNGLNVSEESFTNAVIVYHITIATTVLSTLTVPYTGLLIANENFKFTTTVEILCGIFRLAAVMTLLYNMPNRLVCYSVIMALTSLLHYLANILYSWKHYRSMVLPRRYKDKNLYQQMLSYSGWNALGTFTHVGKTQITAVIINFFFGTVVNAAFAVANQINNFIVMFANTLNTAAAPQITKNLSGGNQDRSIGLTARISKYTFFMMLLAAFPVLMEIDFLLGLWLKEVPTGSNVFCLLIVVAGLFTCICQGTGTLVNASGKIKWFQIIGSIYTLLSFPLGALLYYIGFNSYTLPIVLCVFGFFQIILNMILLKRILDFDVISFARISYLPMVLVSTPLAICLYFYDPSDFTITGHVIGMILSFFLVSILILILGIDRQEREVLRKAIVKVKNKL